MTTKRTSKRRTSRGGKRRSSKKVLPVRKNWTPPQRGFHVEPRDTDLDEDGELTLRGKIRQEMIQKLASEWNAAHGRAEERSFRSDEDRDAEADMLSEVAQDRAYEEASRQVEGFDEMSKRDQDRAMQPFVDAFFKEQKEKDSVDAERLSVIQEMLGELGARMMRPYEHWNEEEQYREYAERDRDDE